MAARLMMFAIALAAAPAWAACPPDCPYRLGIETTLTLDDGEVQREQRLTFSRDFGVGDILGSSGSFRLGLSSPFLIGDPLRTSVSLDATLLWSPIDSFTPLELLLRTPLTPLQEALINDPLEDGRPSIRIILPSPIRWRWAPRPFLGGDDRSVEAGLIFSYVSALGTAPGATSFMADAMRVDYTIRAVPEPEIWTLWIAGLGLTGAFLRQRKLANA